MASLGRPTVWSLLVASRYQLIAAFRWLRTDARSMTAAVCAIAVVIPIANRARIGATARWSLCLLASAALSDTLRLTLSDRSSLNFNMILFRSVMFVGWAGSFTACRTGKRPSWVIDRNQT